LAVKYRASATNRMPMPRYKIPNGLSKVVNDVLEKVTIKILNDFGQPVFEIIQRLDQEDFGTVTSIFLRHVDLTDEQLVEPSEKIRRTVASR
jgi:hypothetical protein